MKKRLLITTFAAGFAYISLTSHSGGLAYIGGIDRTGAQGTSNSCGNTGSGCHGGNGSATTVTITVDSGSTSVTRYVPGGTYTVKIHGTNSNSLPGFGFQFATVSGTGVSQVQAGACSGWPTHVTGDPLAGLTIVEQTARITAATAGVYDESFTWTAPATGVGNITMYCTLNAVNDNGNADAGDISNNTSLVLTQEAKPSGVANVWESMSLKAYPNPVGNTLNLLYDNAADGDYQLSVYSITGATVAQQTVTISGASSVTTLSTANWTPGLYQAVLEQNGMRKVISLVKN